MFYTTISRAKRMDQIFLFLHTFEPTPEEFAEKQKKKSADTAKAAAKLRKKQIQ
jgi:hypothetical protein